MSASLDIRPIVLWAKRHVANALCADGVGRLLATVLGDRIPFRGIVVDTSSPAFSSRVKAQLFWRVYESAECRFVQHYLRGAECAIELGSSLGVVSSHLGRVMQDQGRLICVEANPVLIPVIKSALAEIQADKALSVDVIHAAIVGDTEQEMADLQLGGGTVGSTTVQTIPSGGHVISVPAVALSDVVQRHAVGQYVLVSDIEGAETSFIFSDDQALSLCRRMVIELHDRTGAQQAVHWEELLQALIDRGFSLIAQSGPVVVLERARIGDAS